MIWDTLLRSILVLAVNDYRISRAILFMTLRVPDEERFEDIKGVI